MAGAGSGIGARVEYKGSDSYRLPDGRTLIKLIPQSNGTGEKMLLVVLTGMVKAAGIADLYFPEGPYIIGIGKNSREFAGRTFDTYPGHQEETEYSWVISALWQTALEQ